MVNANKWSGYVRDFVEISSEILEEILMRLLGFFFFCSEECSPLNLIWVNIRHEFRAESSEIQFTNHTEESN